MTAKEFESLFAQFVSERNFSIPHSALAGRTPFEAWADDALEELDVVDQGLRLVDETLLERHTLKPIGMRVVKRGCVTYDKVLYVSPGLPSVRAGRVEVRIAPHDDSFVECWDGDAFVCRAWKGSSLTDAEVDAIIDGRTAVEQLIRQLRRTGAGYAATRQGELVKEVNRRATKASEHEDELVEAASIVPLKSGDEMLASLDEQFSKRPS